MEIKWKSGSQHKIEAQVAYDAIESIRAKNFGDVTAEDLVVAAKSKRSPMHVAFEWDDSVAGHAFRLEQARSVLRSLVVVRGEIKTDRPQRCFEIVKVPQTGKGEKPVREKHVYRSLEAIMSDPDTRGELLGRALRELIAIRNRYRDLQELAVVMRAIDEVLEHVDT